MGAIEMGEAAFLLGCPLWGIENIKNRMPVKKFHGGRTIHCGMTACLSHEKRRTIKSRIPSNEELEEYNQNRR